jgi:ATP-dependent helicase/nuclease subunit A
MTRPSDWQQRELGRNLHHSYIVQAPAGSGKTELLTQRMLGLLACVENPEEVVAITFTRKAAAEMSHRLVSRLQAAAGQRNDLDKDESLQAHEQISRDLALAVLQHDASQGWNLLEQPSRLRIRTIDSLCSELARQLPVLSGLGGGQQIAVDANALYRKAAVRTMAAIEDHNDPLKADVVRVLDRYDNQYDRLVNLLTNMLANREQWIEHLLSIRNGENFDRQGMQQALQYLVENQLEMARQSTSQELLAELPRFIHFALSNSPDDTAALNAMMAASGGLETEVLDLPVTADALPHWQTMIRRLLTADGKKWRAAPDAKAGFPPPSKARGEDKVLFKIMKDGFKALLDEHRENDKLRDIYNTVNSLPSPYYEDEAWESLESLMRILLRAASNWTLVMAETGEVDFGEIANRAIESLGHEGAPSDLALRMDYRIQHLLVDEFQDTSASQVRLLEQLTTGWSDGDGRTLFLVGDPMQSIYRFRKAEVSLFIKAWEGGLFDHIQLTPLRLSVNFRSTRPIVDWVNQVFPVVMPSRNDPVMGAVSYSQASTKPGVADTGEVALHISPERDDAEEARRIIDVIGLSEPAESIAILVRSRNHAGVMLAEFDKLKVSQPRYRYQAIKLTRLAETILIQDLVSLTLALIQPADRLAWLATLRSPYIGLNLADMDELVAGNSDTIILDAITTAGSNKDQVSLSEDGQERLFRTAPILLQAINQRGRQSVRSLVESTWVSLGGPACVNNASELDDATTYFDLLDSLEQENLPVDRDTLDLRLGELYAEPDANADGSLQILTIHSAKGLQFDTVILPGLNRAPGGDDNKLLHWFELAGEGQIVMSPMRNNAEKEQQKKSGDLIQFISGIEKQRQKLEDGRLLYVAATRAKHRLYLFGAIKPSSKGEIKANGRSLLGSLWPAVENEQVPLISSAAAELLSEEDAGTGAQSTRFKLPQDYRRLAANWKLPEAPSSVSQTPAEHAETQDYIEFSWAGEDARHTGNLVHSLLQLIGEQGLEAWEAGSGMSGRHNWCRQKLSSEGIQKDKAIAIIERVSRAVENCLTSVQGRWILENHEDSRCEYAITAVLESARPVNLVLDRTFVENGIRWIIDYKTSSHGGGDLEGFLDNEANRYRAQLQLYKSALALTENRPIKTALYFPMLDRLLEVN